MTEETDDEEEDDDQYKQVCGDQDCDRVLDIDCPMMCWNDGTEENEKTLCRECWEVGEYWKTDKNEDNEDDIEAMKEEDEEKEDEIEYEVGSGRKKDGEVVEGWDDTYSDLGEATDEYQRLVDGNEYDYVELYERKTDEDDDVTSKCLKFWNKPAAKHR